MAEVDQTEYQTLTQRITKHAYTIEGKTGDWEALMQRIGDARFVLLGEATHGSQEFYAARAAITQRLIEEKGFSAVVVEADWPDAYRVNRYVQGLGKDTSSQEALGDFQRFPTWMWRNTEMVGFVDWLRQYNQALPASTWKAGFYGMDLYSLSASTEAVIGYLEKVDPEAALRARYRYGCFDHYGEDPQAYGYAASFDLTPTCENEVVAQLQDLQRQAEQYVRQDGFSSQDEFFYAEQNARIAQNAERYYRSMFAGRTDSWNLRDRHMMETLEALVDHFDRQGKPCKLVVWAHNSHVGDARATESRLHRQLNVGQLVRERYGQEAVLVGFTTYSGTVSAASDWGAPVERKFVRPSLPGSFGWIFHATEMPSFYLLLTGMHHELADLNEERLERAIGVIYRPQSERLSHYFGARLFEQFDVVAHFDQTHALEPLERNTTWDEGEEVPETFPSGL